MTAAGMKTRDLPLALAQILQLSQLKADAPAALRSAAADAQAPGEKRLLEQVAADLESGLPTEQALTRLADTLPADWRAKWTASLRTKAPVSAFIELQVAHTRRQESLQGLSSSLAYPCLLLVLVWIVACVQMYWVVPNIQEFLTDLSIPFSPNQQQQPQQQPQTATAFSLFLLVLGPVALIVGLCIWLAPHSKLASAVRDCIPLLGGIYRYNGLASFSSTVAVLLKYQLPYAQALDCAADSANSWALAQQGKRLAQFVATDRLMESAIARLPRFPVGMGPLLAWGEQACVLPEVWDSFAEVYDNFAKSHSRLTQVIVPPIVFLIAFGAVLAMISLEFTAVMFFRQQLQL